MKFTFLFKVFAVLIILFVLAQSDIRAQDYWENSDSTISIVMPVVPGAWESYQDARTDTITIPNYRPVYALIVSGYSSNKYMDEITFYNLTKHLQSEGAYVHFSWWNNLLSPYMERPLHWNQSEPGNLGTNVGGFIPFPNQDGTFDEKAVPEDDYQLQADAERFLRAIRAFNPDAIIIVAGHSMGGGAVARLGSETNQIIDILAPIDPVGNRSVPFAPPWLIDPITPFDSINQINPHFPWTRWRAAHENFLGWRQYNCDERYKWTGLCKVKSNCVLVGPWIQIKPLLGSVLSLKCLAKHPFPFAHQPPRRRFNSNVINLFHRYQQEAIFPFDFGRDEHFLTNTIACASVTQQAIPMKGLFDSDPGGWEDQGWSGDGHGELIGYRGPLVDNSSANNPRQLGLKVRTSIHCDWDGFEIADSWPIRKLVNDTWDNGDGMIRKNLLMEFAQLCQEFPDSLWENRPTRPNLCLVSDGMIELYEKIKLGYGPSMAIELYPNSIWPPNHEMIEIQATVEAVSGCGEIVNYELVSIVSNEEDDWLGDGHTTGDIADATIGEYDKLFMLRSERTGLSDGRVYTITYRVTDISGNEMEASANVVVENLPPGNPKGFSVHYNVDSGNQLVWQDSRDPDFKNFNIYRSTNSNFIPTPEYLVNETGSSSWLDSDFDDNNVFYKITAVDQTGLESVATSPKSRKKEEFEIKSIESVIFTILPMTNLDKTGVTSQLVLLGTDKINVLDIYPYSLSLSGISPKSWEYANAAEIFKKIETTCDCPKEEFEDQKVLLLNFERTTLENMLSNQPTTDLTDMIISQTETSTHNDRAISFTEIEVSIDGELKDGTPLSGQAYILFKGSDNQSSGNEELPIQYVLESNYPNPFNPSTNIGFTLPKASHVSLEVFNMAGQRVEHVIDEHMEAGVYTINWDGNSASSGVYLYRLVAGNFSESKKMLLLK